MEKLKIAKCLIMFLPGVLSMILDVFKNRSHLKKYLRQNCLNALHNWCGVLLDDRWCDLSIIGQLSQSKMSENIKNNKEQIKESKSRIFTFMKQLTELIFQDDDKELYYKLTKLVEYQLENCHKLEIDTILIDILTKLLLNETLLLSKDTLNIVLKCFVDFKDKDYLIKYAAFLFDNTLKSLFGNENNIEKHLKMLKICFIIGGVKICINSEVLPKLLSYFALVLYECG